MPLAGAARDKESPLLERSSRRQACAPWDSRSTPDTAVLGETMLLLLPGMMAYPYDKIPGVLASKPRL